MADDSAGTSAVRALLGGRAFLPCRSRMRVPTTSVLRCVLTPVLLLLLLCLASCGGYEDARIRQLMHEKGFGTRAQGNATVENYLTGGDAVQFVISSLAYQSPDSEKLFLLTMPQAPSIDGTILLPYVGPVYVLGMTEKELATLIKNQYRPIFKMEIDVQARIRDFGKVIFAFGETSMRGPVSIAQSDMTLFAVIARIGWTQLANVGRVYLIRPDAENPLVMVMNLREMVHTGLTATNFPVRENDIIYIPPTFLGMLARMIERLLMPVAVAVQTVLGVANIRWAWYTATDQNSMYRF